MNTGNIHPPILTISLREGVSFDMVYVEGGEFLMGDDSSEEENEKPAHRVKISSFYLGKFQVTQALWEAITQMSLSSYYKGKNRPIEPITWEDAKKCIKILKKETGRLFRLPTEAEWEFAARGGIYSQDYIYVGSDKLEQVGWYSANSYNETHPVGLKMSNELGLYDMSGNVWEWCEDDGHQDYNGAPKDGSAWIRYNRDITRIRRGGGFFNIPKNCRPLFTSQGRWHDSDGFISFRLCLSPSNV